MVLLKHQHGLGFRIIRDNENLIQAPVQAELSRLLFTNEIQEILL